MPRTQEIPQVYPENIPMVSMFQGYNPETMAQVEGPQQGGWVPLMQDPITMGALAGGGAAVAGIPGMFAQLAQMYGPQMVPQARWQKIPNTTEPDLGSGMTMPDLRYPTTYGTGALPPGQTPINILAGRALERQGIPSQMRTEAEGRKWPTMPELSGPKGMGPIGGPATTSIGDEGFAMPTQPLTPSEKPMTEDRLRAMLKKSFEDYKAQGRPIKIPVTEEGLTVEEALRRHGTPARTTGMIGGAGVSPFGTKLWYGPSETVPLPSITDLFREIPE